MRSTAPSTPRCGSRAAHPAARLGAVLAMGLLAARARSAPAAPRDWVGSARCGACHPAQLEAWQATAHARRLAPGRGAGRCAGCHTTGDWPAGDIVESVVGCEACHGAGADYAAEDLMRNPPLAIDLGLRELRTSAQREQLCATCHGAVTSRGVPVALDRRAHPATAPAGGSPGGKAGAVDGGAR